MEDKKKKVIEFLIFLVLLVVLIINYCGKLGEKDDEPGNVVAVETVMPTSEAEDEFENTSESDDSGTEKEIDYSANSVKADEYHNEVSEDFPEAVNDSEEGEQ